MYEREKKRWIPRLKIRNRKINRSFEGDVTIFIFLTIIGLFTALPLYLAVINSLKPLNELWIFPPKFYVVNPTLNSYKNLFTMFTSSDSVVPITRYLFNTVFITVVGTAGQVLFSSMCAYPLAKHNFPGAKLYSNIIMLSLMFSPAVTAIPNYLTMSRLGWIDTYWALIIPVMGSTLGLYLTKQFIEQLPDAILESARIDGASEYRIFWSIVMPSIKPAWLTVLLLSVQSLWNMGANPFIFTEQLKTLNYALGQIISAGIARAGEATAIQVVMMLVPITIFIATQSRVIETMTNSGIKE